MTVSEVARRFDVKPQDVSLLFYHRRLPDSSCPIKNRRRDIPEAMLPRIEAALRDAGKLPAREVSA